MYITACTSWTARAVHSQVEEFLRRPENEWTITPKKFMTFATFMNQQGIIANNPATWRKLFFDNITDGN